MATKKEFCLIPEKIEDFKKALKFKEIKIEDLIKMSTQERTDVLKKYAGENAKDVNLLFEQKLVLKNWEKGLENWFNKITKSGRYDPKKLAEIKESIAKQKEIKHERTWNPGEDEEALEGIVNDLVDKELGIDVSLEDVKEIMRLSKEVEAVKDFSSKESIRTYGNALFDLQEYEANLVPKGKMSKSEQTINILNLPRTAMSTLDFSAPLRQGWGMMSRKEFYSSVSHMFKAAFSEKEYRNGIADIIGHPDYPLMKSSKLRITNLGDKLSEREEAFMSNLIDKIPGVKQSEHAYVGFLNKLRADVFTSMVDAARLRGDDISKGSKALDDISEMINNFTGSGNMGKGDKYAGAVPFLNNIFFSPRKIAASVNILNPVKYAQLTPIAREAALKQLFGSVAITTTAIGLARLAGIDVEINPNSSDFTKIKVGNTRYDLTGGNAAYVTFISRMITGKTKSTTSEIIKDLEGGVGKPSKGTVGAKFLRNKLSPVASFFVDMAFKENAVGDKFKMSTALRDRVTPMTISSMLEVLKNDPKQVVISTILNSLGAGVSSYSSGVDWNQSDTQEMKQAKEQVGQKRFDEINKEFNQIYEKRLKAAQSFPEYKNASEEDKQKAVTKLKDDIKSDLFKKNNIRIKRAKPKKTIEL